MLLEFSFDDPVEEGGSKLKKILPASTVLFLKTLNSIQITLVWRKERVKIVYQRKLIKTTKEKKQLN